MRKWGTLVLFLMLSGCQGPDQFIVTRCETTKTGLGLYNLSERCTCFRDNIKKSLDSKTYREVAMSALGHDDDWKAYVTSLKPGKKEVVSSSLLIGALTCQVEPWEELFMPLVPGTT